MKKPLLLLLSGALAVPSACWASKLEQQIRDAEQRLAGLQDRIASATADVGEPGKAVRAEVSYDPIIEWTRILSAAPESRRTFTFQQTDKSGNLADRSHRCVLPFGPYRSGYYARIDEDRSTKARLVLKSIVAEPQPDGLSLAIPMSFTARSQLGFNVRPSCSPWNQGGNIGVTGEATPNAKFRISFNDLNDGTLGYAVTLVSPNRIGVELATSVGGIGTVRYTVPMDNIAQKLLDGRVALLMTRGGELRLPDGKVIGYSVATRNPAVTTGPRGVTVESDLDIHVESDAVADVD